MSEPRDDEGIVRMVASDTFQKSRTGDSHSSDIPFSRSGETQGQIPTGIRIGQQPSNPNTIPANPSANTTNVEPKK